MIKNLKIALLLSYVCIASISAAIITPALPLIQTDYGLSHGSLEWVISIFLVGYGVGQLLYGPLANSFGRLKALRIGLIINLLGILICILASSLFPNYLLLLLGRLVTALGAASGLSCTFMLLNELLPPDKAKQAMSLSVLSFTGGIGLSVTLGGILTEYVSWQACFWALLLHGFVMLLLTWQFPETLKKPTPFELKGIFLGYLSALKSSSLIAFSLLIGFVSVFAYGFSATAPLYTQLELHLSPSTYGYWNLVNMLGMLSSGIISAIFIKKYGPKKLLLIGISATLPALLSLILLSFMQHSNVAWFFATTTALYLFTGLLFPSASYFASNAITDRANASGMMSFINMGSATLSVVIIGYLPFRPIVSFTVIVILFFILSASLALKYLR